MVISPRLLDDGEHVLVGTRTHVEALALPVLLRTRVLPFLRWLGTTYVLADRRLVTRTGLLTRTGHDLQLDRASDLTCEKSLLAVSRRLYRSSRDRDDA